MRVAYFGTPEFAVPALDALLAAGHEVAAVVTQPDRPRGRSHSTLVPPPVKLRAIEAGLDLFQPDRPRGDLFNRQLRDLDLDLGVVVAYGHLLLPELLQVPRLGMVNVHASLLPRWRGAAPIQWAVLSGDRETGVSIMRMEAGLDSGPVWHRAVTPLLATDTSGDLFERLATLGATALAEVLPRIESGEEPEPQDPSQVTLAPKLDRTLAQIDWERPAAEVSCWIRGMDPAPGAWTTVGTGTLKCFGATVLPGVRGEPGTVVAGDRLTVACGEGAVMLTEVQPAGRRRMSAGDWQRGGGVAIGAQLR
jgi:methionyl-tRNA formyltransferase